MARKIVFASDSLHTENKQKKMSKVVHMNVTEVISTEIDFEGMIQDTRMLPSISPDNLGILPATKIHSPSFLVKVQFSASSSNGLWTIAGVPNKIGHVSRSKDAPYLWSQLVHPDLTKGANYVKSIANSAIEIARIKSLEDGVGPVFIVRIDFYYHVKIESNVPGQTTILRCHPKWNNDSNAGISGREWFDCVEVNWEKGDGSSFYTVPAKLFLWGNVIFSNSTTILLACIRSLKSSTEMKIHKYLFLQEETPYAMIQLN